MNMERTSLLVVSTGLILLGLWELLNWPKWIPSTSPLFIMLGKSFSLIYGAVELASAAAITALGLLGIYFASGISTENKNTGRFEFVLLIPLTVLFTSSLGFVIFGSELMAHNGIISAALGRLWKWRFNHSRGPLYLIEDTYQCCGWGRDDQNNYALSRFCSLLDHSRIRSCNAALLNISGRQIYRIGLAVLLYSLPLLLLAILVIWSHKHDPIASDIEDAEFLDERRKQLFAGQVPAIQLQ